MYRPDVDELTLADNESWSTVDLFIKRYAENEFYQQQWENVVFNTVSKSSASQSLNSILG